MHSGKSSPSVTPTQTPLMHDWQGAAHSASQQWPSVHQVLSHSDPALHCAPTGFPRSTDARSVEARSRPRPSTPAMSTAATSARDPSRRAPLSVPPSTGRQLSGRDRSRWARSVGAESACAASAPAASAREESVREESVRALSARRLSACAASCRGPVWHRPSTQVVLAGHSSSAWHIADSPPTEANNPQPDATSRAAVAAVLVRKARTIDLGPFCTFCEVLKGRA